ncbi:MAG: TerC/Alx family metal homeostasis membrane protein, partial [Saprospiraceae bacterium]|nr:TerC/Alx family metal homeostasis membrane protein [Saprospiraceae bacterium]
VIAVIFNYFRIPPQYQHRVLFWGIIGALVFRGIMIAVGVVLISRFSWISYVFGAILLYSAYKMLSADHEGVDPEKNRLVQLFKKFFPVVNRMEGEHFFIRKMGVKAATPLFVALLVVETTDVMFAFDSIPAIFAITTDPFLVFTSNIFAILGLRSLYFVLASFLGKFRYLQYSLVAILGFVGIKMILLNHVHFPEWSSLVVIVALLGVGVLASLAVPERRDVGS